ncbi:outer membrane lipid asymmetry maintenance protein MlaD [Marinomonas agarivorans]|nr:outer membrane lipid asymmetry maintenance protein MlaD [Marinomonas agarivorans]
MKSKQLELFVGLFIVLGFASLAYLAIQVSGLGSIGKGDVYQIQARFEDIGGLTERAKVSVSGVTIGEVESIVLDKELYMALVTLNINTDMAVIPVDSAAAILTNGLLGEKYIGISIGAEEEYLKNGDEITDTQSALVLETLISQFLFESTSGDDE